MKTIPLRYFNLISLFTIVLLALVPLFADFPYRVNIFLSWEGAYRMYLGQIPYKDFGLPMGYGYWLIPALFFKLFGPFMSSLIKAQVFINILSGLAFWQIMRALGVKPAIQSLCILVYCLSYSFFNFWPWYNHSVIVFQFISLAFLLTAILKPVKNNWIILMASAFFSFLSFFTKQDAGGLCLMISTVILAINFLYDRKLHLPFVYFLAYGLIALAFFVPNLSNDIGYWFNYGQEPHNSRLSINDFLEAILGQSQWIKFYFLVIGLTFLSRFHALKDLINDKERVMTYAVVVLILIEALLFQVTSYTPPDNNIFYHSFGFLFFITQFPVKIETSKWRNFSIIAFLVVIWWSGVYWKYIDRVLKRAFPEMAATDSSKISVKTFMRTEKEGNIGMDKWVFSPLKAFENVYMPQSTVDGMQAILDLDIIRSKENPRVLNMTELTPLAYEMPYELEKNLPLWYHEGVSMFAEHSLFFTSRVESGYYDLILFETIPYLNNFFPETVRKAAIKHYELKDTFLAPRRPTDSFIEVYIKKEN